MNDREDRSVASLSTRHGSLWGHVLVAACACVLTVAIIGSAAFLTYRVYSRYRMQAQVRSVVASLQNRTPDELAEKAAQIRAHPKVARLVLPEVLKSLRHSRSEKQQCSVIQILKVFLDDRHVEQALFHLRRDSREDIAAAAVEALGNLEPAERAADVVGRCLDDVKTHAVVDAAVDEACAALVKLGEAGRREMEKRLAVLSVDRRVWLVGYVCEAGGTERDEWLKMLRSDGDERVRTAAAAALRSVASGDGVSTQLEGGTAG
ncbi:MAG: hypothetical protein JXQ75_11050 [Phycisphaerae bacterium]|nr:hypothetical protein [Phycisphaerae bacterium]